MSVIYAYVLVCVKHNLIRRELNDLAPTIGIRATRFGAVVRGGRRLRRHCVVAQRPRRRGEKAAEVLCWGAEAAVARHGGGVEVLRGHGGRSGAMRRPWKQQPA